MTNGIGNVPVFTPIYKYQSKQAREDAAKALEEKAAREAEKKKQQEADKKAALVEKQNELSMLEQQLENSKEQGEATADSFETFSKCLTIAQRITRGDKVPLKDMKYLMEHEPDLYKQAILMRQPNSKPKEYDSVLDEDDSENKTEESGDTSSDSGNAPPVSEAPVANEAPAVEVAVTE